jgi:hypothetical protein
VTLLLLGSMVLPTIRRGKERIDREEAGAA